MSYHQILESVPQIQYESSIHQSTMVNKKTWVIFDNCTQGIQSLYSDYLSGNSFLYTIAIFCASLLHSVQRTATQRNLLIRFLGLIFISTGLDVLHEEKRIIPNFTRVHLLGERRDVSFQRSSLVCRGTKQSRFTSVII